MTAVNSCAVSHPIPPVYDSHSRILILGSFPSVKSRENGFFYGHSRNRFWKTVSAVIGRPEPKSIEEKKKMLLDSGVALWDVIASCEISASSDSSIKNAVPNDISPILAAADIRRIFVNGKSAEKYYRKFILPVVGIEAVTLPSTSPANAAYSLDKLIESWRIIFEEIK